MEENEVYFEEEEPTFSPEKVLTVVAWIILVLGLLGTILCFFKLCFVPDYEYSLYGGMEYNGTKFEPLGLVVCFYMLFLSVSAWAGILLSVKMSRTLTAIKNK